MKVSAISTSYVNQNYAKNHISKNHQNFEAKDGKIAGGVIGAVAGGTALSAVVGGGSLAGTALLAATGPVGLGVVALYTIGGAVLGRWLGSEVGDAVTDKNNKNGTKA